MEEISLEYSYNVNFFFMDVCLTGLNLEERGPTTLFSSSLSLFFFLLSSVPLSLPLSLSLVRHPL